MTDDDRPLLARWLTAASEVYDRPVSEAGLEVWWNLLRAFPTHAVDRAFKAHLADPDTGRFFPRPADIIGRVTGGSEARAYEAWAKVQKAIRHHGGNSSVAFDDPLIHAVIDSMGGWPRLCMMREDDAHFRRQDFTKTYTAYRQRGERPKYSGVLYGRFDTKRVALIGDETKARETIEHGTPMDMTGRILPLAALDALEQTLRLGHTPEKPE